MTQYIVPGLRSDRPSPDADGPESPIPHADPRPVERTLHGDTITARYRWLRAHGSPEVVAHLAAENAYTDRHTARLRDLRASLEASLDRSVPLPQPSAPVLDGGWWYIDRAQGAHGPTLSRVRDRDGLRGPDGLPPVRGGDLLDGEQILLQDRRLVAGIAVSADHSLFARAEVSAGGCVVTVTRAETGEVVDQVLRGAGPDLVFTADGTGLIHTALDELGRRHQVRHHRLGTDGSDDTVLLEEPDHWAELELTPSRDGSALLVRSASPGASEVWLLDLTVDHRTPRSVTGRRPGQHPVVEHAGDRLLVLRTDAGGRSALFEAPLDTTDGEPGATALLTARDREQFESIEAFADFAALQVRADGLPGVRIIPRRADGSLDTGALRVVGRGGELDAVHLEANPDWTQRTLRYSVNSFLTPTVIAETDLVTGDDVVLSRAEVPGFDPERYVERRLWATSADGTQVPVSLLARRDIPADGTAPGVLYGAGAFGAATDPVLMPETLQMIDRGVVVAIAHVRGGGEMGADWHQQGRRLQKANSFDDFVACADHLVAAGWIAEDRLGAVGVGAGGLLVGAAVNRAPERFRAVVAGTPLVDPLETLLDPDVMLTLEEWAEWGDPAENAADYHSLRSYSPAENVRETEYPAVFAWTALEGPDIPMACAAIWIAQLRDRVTSDLTERPILLRCTRTLGEDGDPRLEGVAWLLDQLGAATLEG